MNTSTKHLNKSFQPNDSIQYNTFSKDTLGPGTARKRGGVNESFFVRVSFNEEHHMSPENKVMTKTITMELPLKLTRNKKGHLKIKNEEDKSLMHKLTMQFLEECNAKFGLPQSKLRHIFKARGALPRYGHHTDSSSMELMLDHVDTPGGEHEEIMDISEIVSKNLDHVFVSMVPFVRSNQQP